MTTQSSTNIVFLYDYEMERFIRQNKNSDFITMTDNLILSSRRFLFYFDSIKEFKEVLLGYEIEQIAGKYILSVQYNMKNVEFRQDWVQKLGRLLSKEYDFTAPLFVSYDDVLGQITSLTFEDLDLTDEGLFV